jgi:indolepyruvate ferredoxin oxidoreductase beta subunit
MSDPKAIKIAILAMGGEGGGVLTGWLAHAAEEGGYLVQTTSVPGVAQRTGATIYYVELFARGHAQMRGKAPVLGLMPMPGDVDVVIASELMEAGRAIQRGLVTSDRTALIASTHRVYSMKEKTALADGRVDSEALLAACRAAAQKFVGFDMAAAAESSKSVISAVLLGAVAGSGALPIPGALFKEAIRAGGVSIASSLAAFDAGRAAAEEGAAAARPVPPSCEPRLPRELAQAVRRHACKDAEPLILAGLERAAEYQDWDYAALYWRRLLPFVTLAEAGGPKERELLAVTARQLALGMTYEDTVRVAELKLRASRFARIRAGLGLDESQILEIAEFMHPRVEEIADTMPAGLGRRLLGSTLARGFLQKFAARGRIVRTTSLSGFLLLYGVASLKAWRRTSLRFARETKFLEDWLGTVLASAKHDVALAASLAHARNLVKGYGDTYRRGISKYERICEFVKSNGFSVAAEDVRALIAAAEAEEGMQALEIAIAKLSARGFSQAGHCS